MTHDSKPKDTTRRRFLRQAAILGASAMLPAACSKGSSNDAGEDAEPGQMTKRTNPNTGDSVSLLGYGCMRLPLTPEGEIDQEMVNRQVDYALAHGVNYFDTAPVYCEGRSEHAMGIALSRHHRDSYLIATKLSNFSEDKWPREQSIAMFENSLKELQTDHIDYLLLHGIGMKGFEAWNGRYRDNGVLDYLIEQKEAGRIRNLGFSYHGDVAVFDHLLEMMDRGEVHWDFAQIQLNYVDWKHARELNPDNTDAEYLYQQLHKRGIPVVIMEPLLGGQLARASASTMQRMQAMRPDNSVASWAFRFAGTPEGVLTVLSGMTYMEHLQENVATYSPLVPITPEEDSMLQVAALELIANKPVPCTGCRYCMPCPYGVDIPGNFLFYNRCIDSGKVTRSSLDPKYAQARRAFLTDYDRAVDPRRQASRCIACGKCQSACPQRIPIARRLAEIASYTDDLRWNKLG